VPWIVHRDERWFRAFDPDRWLDGRTASLPNMRIFRSAADRGSALATRSPCSETLILAMILQRFRLGLLNLLPAHQPAITYGRVSQLRCG
jgi:hypothetical protein